VTTPAYSKGVRAKARKLVREGAVTRDEEFAHVWWVASSSTVSGRPYRVEITDGVASCSCKYGLIQGGADTICSHRLAVELARDVAEVLGPRDDDDVPNPGGDPDDYDREHGRVPR
jgi:hypothetical protein